MTYFPEVPRARNTTISPKQEAAIRRALSGGKITESEAGMLQAVAIYGSADDADRAQAALATRSGKGTHR